MCLGAPIVLVAGSSRPRDLAQVDQVEVAIVDGAECLTVGENGLGEAVQVETAAGYTEG